MGLREDVSTRQGLIDSMEDVYLKQFIFIRNLAGAIQERFPSEASGVLAGAFRQFGFWRGEHIRLRSTTIVEGRDAFSLLRNWDGCDLVLAELHSGLTVEGTPEEAMVTFGEVPGVSYFEKHDGHELLDLYWRNVFAGIAQGFQDTSVEVGPIEDLRAPLRVTWRFAGSVRDKGGGLSRPDVLADPPAAIEMIRRASRANGALYFFIARETVHRFDAAGEQAVRDGVRRIGVERGTAHRERHLREGKELNLKNLMEDWDGPLVSVWMWRDEGFLSEGTWHQDCVWCPYADAWQEFGQEGLALGYLYDMEVHTTIFQTYRPGTVVQWEALKTRGDPVCKFRFSIPDLVRPGEPRFNPDQSTRPRLPLVPPT